MANQRPMRGIRTTVELRDEGGTLWCVASWPESVESIRVGSILIPACTDLVIVNRAGDPKVSLTMEVRHGVPCFTRISVESADDGRALIGQDLAIIRGLMLYWLDEIPAQIAQNQERDFARMPEWADQATAKASLKATKQNRRPRRSDQSANKRVRHQMTPEFLADVARIYRAYVDGQPTEAVRLAYAVPYRTAARWVELCRSDEHRLLSPPPGKGKRKA
jgi:hypothetical protein